MPKVTYYYCDGDGCSEKLHSLGLPIQWTQEGDEVYCPSCGLKRREQVVDEAAKECAELIWGRQLSRSYDKEGFVGFVAQRIERYLLAQRRACAREVNLIAYDLSGVIKKTILFAKIQPEDFE